MVVYAAPLGADREAILMLCKVRLARRRKPAAVVLLPQSKTHLQLCHACSLKACRRARHACSSATHDHCGIALDCDRRRGGGRPQNQTRAAAVDASWLRAATLSGGTRCRDHRVGCPVRSAVGYRGDGRPGPVPGAVSGQFTAFPCVFHCLCRVCSTAFALCVPLPFLA